MSSGQSKFWILWRHQQGRCCWCGKKLAYRSSLPRKANKPKAPTFEHLTPRSMGGTNSLTNLALAHRACNMLGGGELGWPSSKRERE